MQAELLSRLRGWEDFIPASNITVVIGSSDTHARLVRKFTKRGIRVLKNYGLTEAGPFVMSQFASLDSADDEFFGPLNPGFEMRLSALPKYKEIFEIELQGEALFDGYMNATRPEWLKTGDAVQVRDGKLFFLCRSANLLRRDRRWFAPNVMERDLLNHFDSIRECLIEGVRPWKLSLAGEFSDPAIPEIRRHLQRKFGLDEVRVEILPRLRRTRSGKLIRPEAAL
jgi:acyl-CoA synthetase (AMP-forming)/AMP-acid ligase II